MTTDQTDQRPDGHAAEPLALRLNDQLGLVPIGPHDHPDPHTMVWSESELRAIRQYAARCVAAERDRMRDLCAIDMASATLKASELVQAEERKRCAELETALEALVNRCNADFVLAADEAVIAAEAALERLYRARKA